MIYNVYGDETLLQSFDSLREAEAWANRYVTSGGMGGYNVIEVSSYAGDGEMGQLLANRHIVHKTYAQYHIVHKKWYVDEDVV